MIPIEFRLSGRAFKPLTYFLISTDRTQNAKNICSTCYCKIFKTKMILERKCWNVIIKHHFSDPVAFQRKERYVNEMTNMSISILPFMKKMIVNKYWIDHLFNNGTASKIQYIYNLENSSSNDNRAFSFKTLHWCGL